MKTNLELISYCIAGLEKNLKKCSDRKFENVFTVIFKVLKNPYYTWKPSMLFDRFQKSDELQKQNDQALLEPH